MVLRLFVLTFFVYQCGNSASVESSKQTGKQLFDRYCSSCHGGDGKKMQLGATNLATSSIERTEQFDVIRYGRKGMPSFQQILTENELELVSAFTYSLKEL